MGKMAGHVREVPADAPAPTHGGGSVEWEGESGTLWYGAGGGACGPGLEGGFMTIPEADISLKGQEGWHGLYSKPWLCRAERSTMPEKPGKCRYLASALSNHLLASITLIQKLRAHHAHAGKVAALHLAQADGDG